MKVQLATKAAKYFAGIVAFLCLTPNVFGQAGSQVYDNFEGAKVLHYGERTGVLDTLAKNPAPNAVNNSAHCALYVRNGAKKFANIKMNVPQKLTGVEAYATYLGVPPRLKLKVYTSAPPGTLVEVLLGSKRGNNDYPAGTHSQYQAYTTKSNEWEELTFLFSQIPQGSETAADQIDQIVLLFNPNSSNSDTYYFDELTGPATNGSTGQQVQNDSQQNTDNSVISNQKDNGVKQNKPNHKKDNKKNKK